MPEEQQTIGQLERKTQERVIGLLRDALGYDYLGDWKDRTDNSNVKETYLRQYLEGAGYSDAQISQVVSKLLHEAQLGGRSIYQANKDFYNLLRYGVPIQVDPGQPFVNVLPVDWKHPDKNHFAVAAEVTILGAKTKRPDLVLYINGIAVGVIELKRSTVSVSKGIQQNIGNQHSDYIKDFFTTVQLVMAGNDTEGIRYGTTGTPEDYYLRWKEDGYEDELPLDRHILQLCNKERILEIIHDFVLFDGGIKKTCRHNQYFAVNAAKKNFLNRESGIIWHTQGSGKSLTMVWMAKWISENISNARVLVLTDRTELDDQIEKVFGGVEEKIYRTKSCADLAEQLNKQDEWLMCSLIHKFGQRAHADDSDIQDFIDKVRRALPADFAPKGEFFVFIDECHRSQSGKLHAALKVILPDATFIGFTGTPLLRIDKNNPETDSRVVFGDYIHTYKYDEAVPDGVVLDLRYEARAVPQKVSDKEKVDEFFERKTVGMTEYAKRKLMDRWGTMQALLSSEDRKRRIVFDILDDFENRPRLESGRGNAMLVASSIAEATQYYEIFRQHGFDKCAVVTSYERTAYTVNDIEYRTYEKMLDLERPLTLVRGESEEGAFERVVKERFVKEPANMKLLIVVDKLLTGFDAPSATYLYIDRKMQDHNLFQAICRVNRLDTSDKRYGYVIDYRDLFKQIESAVNDYTTEALSGFDPEDVVGLLKNKTEEDKKDMDKALEDVRNLVEPVEPPKGTKEYIAYFCGNTENPIEVSEKEPIRVELYRRVSSLAWAYGEVANSMLTIGYNETTALSIREEVRMFEKVKQEVKLASGDHLDLKQYDEAMRALLNRYVTAKDSQVLASFDDSDMTLVDLIVKDGDKAVEKIKQAVGESAAETIINNVRKLITDERATNPKYYDRISELLTDLILRRREENMAYQEYLEKIIALAKQVRMPESDERYPDDLQTKAQRSLYDNLGEDAELAKKVHEAVWVAREAEWRHHPVKRKAVYIAAKQALPKELHDELDKIFAIIIEQHEY